MSATPKHTPTPWGFNRHSGPRDVTIKRDHFVVGAPIKGGGGDGVAIVFGPERGNESPSDANAAFIVRAVNAHDALVEALTRLAKWADFPRQWPVGSYLAYDRDVIAAREALRAAGVKA